MKKVLALLLAAIVLCGTFAIADEIDTTIPFEETQVLHLVLGNDEPFRAGETYEDNVWTRWCKDEFNVELKYLWSMGNGSYMEKLRLELAAGGQMPDILYLSNAALLLATELMKWHVPLGEKPV